MVAFTQSEYTHAISTARRTILTGKAVLVIVVTIALGSIVVAVIQEK
jgi:hypothetical protein